MNRMPLALAALAICLSLPAVATFAQPAADAPGLAVVRFDTSDMPDSVGRLAASAVRETDAVRGTLHVTTEQATARAVGQRSGVGTSLAESLAVARALDVKLLLTGKVEKVTDEFFIISASLTWLDPNAETPALHPVRSITREFTSLGDLRDTATDIAVALIDAWTATGPPSTGQHVVAFPAEKTFVFAISAIDREEGDAVDDAVVAGFRDRGVPAEQIVYLKGTDTRYASMLGPLKALLSKTTPGSLMVVYHNGYGQKSNDRLYMARTSGTLNDENAMRISTLVREVNNGFKGANVMFAFDSGASGHFPPAVLACETGVAAISSRSASQDAAQSWTFTRGLRDAFAGHPRFDHNDDGAITIAEWLTETDKDMVFTERRVAAIATNDALDGDLVLAAVQPVPASHHGWTRYEYYRNEVWMRVRVASLDGDNARIRFLNDEPEMTVPVSQLRVWNPPTLEAGTEVSAWAAGWNRWAPATVAEGRHGYHRVIFSDNSTGWRDRTGIRTG